MTQSHILTAIRGSAHKGYGDMVIFKDEVVEVRLQSFIGVIYE